MFFFGAYTNQVKAIDKTQRFEASHLTPFAAKDTAWDRRLINGAINGPTFFARFLKALPNFENACLPRTTVF